MLEASCFSCHSADHVKGGLRLDSLQSLLKGGDDGKIIVLGDRTRVCSSRPFATQQPNRHAA